MTTTCAVVPVYNEAAVLTEVLASLARVVDEIICIDDGSSDGSSKVAAASGATVLRHAINFGQGAALQTGFDYVLRSTQHHHVVTFDADGQHNPNDAARMVAEAQTHGWDVVLGSRGARDSSMPASRRAMLVGARWLSRRMSGLTLTDTHNGLRVFSRTALAQIHLKQVGMAHASEIESLVARQGLLWTELPVSIAYSAYSLDKGQSNLNAVNVMYDLMVARLRKPA